MDAFKFSDLLRTMMNIDRDQLEAVGVLTQGKTDDGGTSWKRWNNEPFMFVMKLDDERLQALWRLLQQQNPKATMTPLQEVVDDLAHVIETLRAARVYVHVANIAAAHQSNREVLAHTGATIRNIDKALADLGYSDKEEPTDGKAQ